VEDRVSTGVLFDAPGPVTAARHRVYSIITIVALVAVAAVVVWRLQVNDQFTEKKWVVFSDPDFIQAILVDGVLATLKMAFTAVVGAVVFGFVLGVGKMSVHRWVRLPSWLVVEFFRAVPVLLLMVFVWYALGIKNESSSYWGVVIALTLYNGSVLAEVLRAGVAAVPKGQAEAAYAIGMRKTQVMGIVMLPQAVKIMLPAIISQCVVALKDTALGFYILAPGLTAVAKEIYGEFNNRVPTMIVTAALYVSINLLLTWLATWAQKRYVGEKKILQVSMVGETEPEVRL
jgi:glutamate transport system permease protein